MGIYHAICYKIEDLFLKVITKKENQTIVKEKVKKYRTEKMGFRQHRKLEKQKRITE